MAQQSNLETRVRAMLNPGLRREQVTRKLFTLASVVVLAALLPIAAVKAPAQSSGAGKISGIVYDASGAVVPNARVVLRNTEGRNTELTRTNPAGDFEIANMPTGKYNLEVAARGFEMYKVAALDITSGASIRQNVVLQLGKITENIDVVGTSPVSKPAQSIAGAPIKVGGSTQALRMVHMVRPSYPATMKAQGIEGIVLMKAVIGREGQILNIEVLNTQVHPDLVEAAKEAVSQWRYEPTLLNGEPVEVMTEITVNFTLAK